MTHTQKANQYAADVVAGRIPACRLVRLACQRHIDDLERAKGDWLYEYEAKKAERVCRFIEMLPHVKGKWAKKDPKTGKQPTIKLEPWQCFVVCSLFGWVKKATGKRRFLLARLYLPRKNAKSTLAAGIGWWMFRKDDEPGAEVYSGATNEKQAHEVFKPAWQMAKLIPDLAEQLGVTLTGKTDPGPMLAMADGSKFETVIGKPGDGASPHCAITDEYHEHQTSEQLDTMITGMGAREQPLSLVISTAGTNIAGPCRADWQTCEKILEGTIQDDTTFALIYTIDDPDKWDTEEALRMANPNFDVSVSREFLLAQLAKARRDPREQAIFKTKHLNLWVTAKAAYFNLMTWQRCENKALRMEDFEGQPCFLAGDLASKHDLVPLIALFPKPDGRYAVFGKYFLPRATVDLPENQHYRAWEASGHLIVTEGNVTDITIWSDLVLEWCKRFAVVEMPIDPARAWGVSSILTQGGVPVVEYRNTVLMMSEPMKQLDALIRAGKIEHDGDPVLSWTLSNVTAQLDKKDNVFPNKERYENKIDPIVSLIMALGRAMVATPRAAGPLIMSW